MIYFKIITNNKKLMRIYQKLIIIKKKKITVI